MDETKVYFEITFVDIIFYETTIQKLSFHRLNSVSDSGFEYRNFFISFKLCEHYV